METLVALVIVAILTFIVFPVFMRAAERSKAQEAVNVLNILRSSQLRYAADTGQTANQIADLDVELTDLSACFDSIQLYAVDPEAAPSSTIAEIRRTEISNPGYGRYGLTIDSTADITCTDEGAADGCSQLNL